MPKKKGRGRGPGVCHPNSLMARSARDPELRERIARNKAKYEQDQAAIEKWAKYGFAAKGPVLEAEPPKEENE